MLVLLIGAYVLMSPISMVTEFDSTVLSALKWSRMAVLGLLLVVASGAVNLEAFNSLPGRLMSFAVVFWLSASWSSNPTWGLLYKGIFVGAVFGGIAIARCLRTRADWMAFARGMTATGAVGVFLVVVGSNFDADAWSAEEGRLRVLGMNPNLLSNSLLVFVGLCTFHILVENRRSWTRLGVTVMMACVVIMILTGSRAALMAIFGVAVVMLPRLLSGRPYLQAALFILLGGAAVHQATGLIVDPETEFVSTYSLADDSAGGRLRLVREWGKDTRSSIWSFALSEGLRHPVVGVGWAHRGNKWSFIQSAWLQAFLESGALGLLLLLGFLVPTLGAVVITLQTRRYMDVWDSRMALAMCMAIVGLLVHGCFESSLVSGSAGNTIVLSVCVTRLSDTQSRRPQRMQIR